MSETQQRVRLSQAQRPELAPLDGVQRRIVDGALARSTVIRGAPGSGKTTCALHLLAEMTARGRSAMLLVPDRLRADILISAVQPLVPGVVRPVRTPAALAYHIVSTWRTARPDPLERVELVTGAAADHHLEELLANSSVEWPPTWGDALRAMPAFRLELRNLFDRASEAGITGEHLSELGERYQRPEWVAAGEILRQWEGRADFALTTRSVMKVPLARLQHMAADLVRNWENEAPNHGVMADIPLPEVLIIDDLQDYTASIVDFLSAAAANGVHIIAFSDPDIGVATYRGGEPGIDRRLAEVLDAATCDLGDVYRGGERLRGFVRTTTEKIAQSGSAARRLAQAAHPDHDGHVSAHVAATGAQLGALIGRTLREHHVHGQIPWDQQVVIVKSSSQVDPMRRHLRRAGVPLAGGRRAFAFASEPVTRILLHLIAVTTVPQAELNPRERRELAENLVASPLVAIDPLDLSQLLRFSQVVNEAPVGEESQDDPERGAHAPRYDIVDLLEDPALVDSLAAKGEESAELQDALPGLQVFTDTDSSYTPTPREEVLANLRRAAAIWAALPWKGHHRPRAALWALWQAAGVAETWQDNAMVGGPDADLYDDYLDAVLALFRVADVWEERYPQGSAQEFAVGQLAENVPVDTLARTGRRPAGVDVLTPAQAVGRQWDVVWVTSLHNEVWPDLRLRDRLLRADLLADLGAGRDADGVLGVGDPRAARRAVLDDERRLFAAAISRAHRHLHVGAILSEDSAPSEFFDVIAGENGPIDDHAHLLAPVPTPLDLSGHIAALRHMAAAPPGPNEDEEEAAQRRDRSAHLLALLHKEGIREADPRLWTGAGGISSTDASLAENFLYVTPSSFETARLCPLQWFLNSIGGRPADSAAQTLGTLVHSLAEHYPHGTREEISAEFEKRSEELGLDLETGAGRQALEHARGVVSALADYLAGVPGQVRTEVPLKARVGDVHISGRIDRLESVEGGVRIVDLKTGKGGNKRSPKKVEDHAQLALYQVGLLANGESVADARLVFLGNEDVRMAAQTPLAGETLEMWRDEVIRVGHLMRGPNYPATPSKDACQYCPHQRSCPAQESGGRTIE
ncbi:MAG: PD-(D/E)XK nuclease family protein [Actinomycetaceae bacterium]|nr:PD-(D/E)XK nuclease family protein [Actinomycetaceae bacterium]